MQNNKKCECGSVEVVYVVQKGRRKKLEAFCEQCLPVEPYDKVDKNTGSNGEKPETSLFKECHP